MVARLRPLWSFDDLDATERRLREALAQEASPPRQAEVLTQLARVEGLRDRFDEGDRLLAEAESLGGEDRGVQAAIRLEWGRLRRSGGDPAAALPLFEAAFALADEAGDGFLAADAAHMAALAAPDRESMLAWTQRGIALADQSADPQVAYWLGPLLNNLGWEYYEAGEFERALAAFERALEARSRDPDRPEEREAARYCVAKTLRALGRPEEAAALLEQAVAWTRTAGRPDAWFHEELAEAYAALGRAPDAREHAALAGELRGSAVKG